MGFFHKRVGNFISNTTVNMPAFGLTNPAAGPRVAEAQAALGAGATTSQIRSWIAANYPALVDTATGGIRGQSGDPLVNFVVTQPVNSAQKAKLWGWEFAIQHRFGETGFGTILNYTVVKSDTKFDNTQRYTVPQFAVNGVSDSANAVLYYDKNGIQARVAYNWRDGFLSGYGFDPYYVEAYGQFDVSASYEFRKGMTAFVEVSTSPTPTGAATCAMTRPCSSRHRVMRAMRLACGSPSDRIVPVHQGELRSRAALPSAVRLFFSGDG